MEAVIAYILIVFGAPVAVAGIVPAILGILFIPILKKSNSKTLWFVYTLTTEVLAGIVMIWLCALLFSWLNLTPSILIPVLLAIPVILWNWERIRRVIGSDTFLDELASGIGNLLGVVSGAIYFL